MEHWLHSEEVKGRSFTAAQIHHRSCRGRTTEEENRLKRRHSGACQAHTCSWWSPVERADLRKKQTLWQKGLPEICSHGRHQVEYATKITGWWSCSQQKRGHPVQEHNASVGGAGVAAVLFTLWHEGDRSSYGQELWSRNRSESVRCSPTNACRSGLITSAKHARKRRTACKEPGRRDQRELEWRQVRSCSYPTQ